MSTDFASFLAQQGAMVADAIVPPPFATQPPPTAELPEWPIAVYQAVGGGIPGEPFVAYPLVPQKKGPAIPMVRCPGATAEAARAAAAKWIADEVEKNRRRDNAHEHLRRRRK